MQELRVYDFYNVTDNLVELFRVVLFVYVLEIVDLAFFGTRVADIVDIKTQTLCQVVETLEFDFFSFDGS